MYVCIYTWGGLHGIGCHMIDVLGKAVRTRGHVCGDGVDRIRGSCIRQLITRQIVSGRDMG